MRKIEALSNAKNCRDSSVAPSKDENRVLKNQSLRDKCNKKVGVQQGLEGTTLKMVLNKLFCCMIVGLSHFEIACNPHQMYRSFTSRTRVF